MDAIFVELPPFERSRALYLSDERFRELQIVLLQNPHAGEVIQHTGGLRKLRFKDVVRGKGTQGGLRIIYYWRQQRMQFLLFTLYNKNEMTDLTKEQCQVLAQLLRQRVRGL
ncbi:toxin [Yokenella regensburgei]|uniref:toxin n=1 Tax=Yokenella regensburgei TaxID=158877 RepID=UPI003EDB03F4